MKTYKNEKYNPNFPEIYKLTEDQIAKHFTLIDQHLFKSIHSTELLHLNFMTSEKGPMFSAMASRFNQWTRFVVTELVKITNIENRAKSIEMWIRVAQASKEMNSFNVSFAIVAALNSSSVSRLKKTWKVCSFKTPKKN